MIKANVYNLTGEKVKEVELNPEVFALKVKPELVAQAVVVFQANQRRVLASTKDRSEVRGGGKKPWRQKGTGRARHGSIRSPLWRGGGITFGPTTDRNFSLKINRKVNRQAILMALSDKAANEKIILVDKLELAEAKTKKFFNILQNLKLREKKISLAKKENKDKKSEKKVAKKELVKSILLVLPKKDEKVFRAARNISKLEVIQANSLNIFALIKNNYLLMPVDSLAEIENTFTK
jgi:large subunit ribosomal protein L4